MVRVRVRVSRQGTGSGLRVGIGFRGWVQGRVSRLRSGVGLPSRGYFGTEVVVKFLSQNPTQSNPRYVTLIPIPSGDPMPTSIAIPKLDPNLKI